MKHTIFVDFEKCPRCEENHAKIEVKQLYGTVEQFGHYCMCPTVDQPIMVDLTSDHFIKLVKEHDEEVEALRVANTDFVAEIVKNHTNEVDFLEKNRDFILDQVIADFELIKNAQSLVQVNEIIALRESRIVKEQRQNEVGE